MSYLPILKEERDRANAYLAGMAARGFGATVEQAIRQASPTNPLNWKSPAGGGGSGEGGLDAPPSPASGAGQ